MKQQLDRARAQHIVLADHDDWQRRSLAVSFKQLGCAVITVADAAELLEELARAADQQAMRPDLIVIAADLPGLPGLFLAEVLRAEGWLEPILLVASERAACPAARLRRLGVGWVSPRQVPIRGVAAKNGADMMAACRTLRSSPRTSSRTPTAMSGHSRTWMA